MPKKVWGIEKLTPEDLNGTVDYLEDLAGGALGAQFAQDTDSTAALIFGYKAGLFRNDNVVTTIADGTVTLTDDDTNYVEVDADGVALGDGSFTSGKVPLYEIITADGTISSISDKRALAALGGGGGDDAITGVTGTTPISVSGSSTKNVSISPATTSAPGSMSVADKAKLDGISGTNTGDQILSISGDALTINGANGNTVTLPAGIPTVTVTAAEALAAGNIIHINDDGEVQLANATSSSTPGIGFVDDDYAEEDTVKVLLGGVITGLSGLTPGAPVFLATTDGSVTQTAPSATGNITQQIGVALTSSSMIFSPLMAVEL